MDRNGYWQDTEDPLEKKMRQLQTIQNQKKLCQEQLETTLTQIAETKKAISVQKKRINSLLNSSSVEVVKRRFRESAAKGEEIEFLQEFNWEKQGVIIGEELFERLSAKQTKFPEIVVAIFLQSGWAIEVLVSLLRDEALLEFNVFNFFLFSSSAYFFQG